VIVGNSVTKQQYMVCKEENPRLYPASTSSNAGLHFAIMY